MNNSPGLFNVGSGNPNMTNLAQMRAMSNNGMSGNNNFNGGNYSNNMGGPPNMNMSGMNGMIPPNMPPNINGTNINLEMLKQPLEITGPTQGTSIASLMKGAGNPNINTGGANGKQMMYQQQNPQTSPPLNKHIVASGQGGQNNNIQRNVNRTNQNDIASQMSEQSQHSQHSYYSQDEMSQSHKKSKNEIKYLVNDLNKSLDDYEPSKPHNTEDSDMEFDSDRDSDKENDTANTKKIKKMEPEINSIFDITKECMLIIFLYVLISQNFVKKGFVSMIPQIQPNIDGDTPITGYFVYGTVLALMIVFFRRLF